VCEPALNTPFPTYYGIQMLSDVGRPGDLMVNAGTDQPLIAAHAVRQANGDLAVMLVNKDPNTAYSVNLHYNGYLPSTATPTVYTYGDEAGAITSATTGTSASQTLPPYSIETIVLTPAANQFGSLSAPGTPSVSAITGTSATLTWGASTGGQVVRYEIEEQYGTTSDRLAESTSNSVTLQNLVPNTVYTLNVLATDQSGKLSEPSDPITFSTTSPASSTCAVNYQITNSWGNGFVASVTLTDTGPSAIDGWSLTFTFPDTTETMSNGWNATWTESGQNVEATSQTWNAQLAPNAGNSQNIGFVGANNGAYRSPTAISLNGTVCTTTYSS
jgi:hypothetical protein